MLCIVLVGGVDASHYLCEIRIRNIAAAAIFMTEIWYNKEVKR